MSANVFTIPVEDYTNPLASVITDYQAAEQFESDKWSEAVSLTMVDGVVMSGDQWKDYYLKAEEEQVASRESNGEIVKRTKKGKIVASQAFPKTWNTDKAIIGKALTEGLDVFDADGNPKAKSALQKEYADTPKDSDKSDYEKILTTINTFQSLYGKLTDQDEIDAARDAILRIVK